MRNVLVPCLVGLCVILSLGLVQQTSAVEAAQKEEVDKVIEDEITQKLSVDLLQSIERKFQVDLERSVDSVLAKIRTLLQNGTSHIQDKLLNLQNEIMIMRKDSDKVDECLLSKQTETSALAEKALHQMVVCGYALIGHDPAQAVKEVMVLKNMIKDGLKPVQQQKDEIYNTIKICGHDHDSLKKVIKCVISKSPLLKSAMMDVTGKLIDGVVHLTKLMAHGAMHEACLIEVVKTVQDEALVVLRDVKICALGNKSIDIDRDVENYIRENNATVLDVPYKDMKMDNANALSDEDNKVKTEKDKQDSVHKMKKLLRRMLSETKNENLDKRFKEKFLKLQKDLGSIDTNAIANDAMNKDE